MFENFDLLRSMANFLKVKDSKIGPAHLFTDYLMPVINIGQNGFAGSNSFFKQNDNAQICAGSALFLSTVIGDTGINYIDNVGKNTRVMGLEAILNFTVAGNAAFVGKLLNVTLRMTNKATNQICIFATPQGNMSTSAGVLQYRLAMILWQAPAAVIIPFNGFVHPDWMLAIEWTSIDGTVFPADTTVGARIFGVQAAAGMQVPI